MTMTLELNQICGVSLKLNDQIADFPQHLSLFIPVLIMRQENKEEYYHLNGVLKRILIL